MPDTIKSQLIRELWFPFIKNAGDYFYPRKKKNKELKIFTLTSDTDYQEILCFLDHNLTIHERIIAWTNSHFKKIRLETELGPIKIKGLVTYENAILSNQAQIIQIFPFHIINLDFSSQNPNLEMGRIETEMKSIEKTIQIQKERGCPFVLIYTTLLDTNGLNPRLIGRNSDLFFIAGWPGMQVDSRFNLPVLSVEEEKIALITYLLEKLSASTAIQLLYVLYCLRNEEGLGLLSVAIKFEGVVANGR